MRRRLSTRCCWLRADRTGIMRGRTQSVWSQAWQKKNTITENLWMQWWRWWNRKYLFGYRAPRNAYIRNWKALLYFIEGKCTDFVSWIIYLYLFDRFRDISFSSSLNIHNKYISVVCSLHKLLQSCDSNLETSVEADVTLGNVLTHLFTFPTNISFQLSGIKSNLLIVTQVVLAGMNGDFVTFTESQVIPLPDYSPNLWYS